MIIIYDSLTGQAKKLADKLGYTVYNINAYDKKVIDKVFLITRSYNFGEITLETKAFLEQYHHLVIGVAVSGNKNWGKNFGAAGDKIEKIYEIPLVLKFESSGFPEDVSIIKKWIQTYLKKFEK